MMHREGADPEHLTEEDILCDFCGGSWAERGAMVEGHRGSCICGRCLTVAYTELVLLDLDSVLQPGERCVMCLEEDRPEPHWRSPIYSDKLICRRCCKQSAGVLQKDPDCGWRKPR